VDHRCHRRVSSEPSLAQPLCSRAIRLTPLLPSNGRVLVGVAESVARCGASRPRSDGGGGWWDVSPPPWFHIRSFLGGVLLTEGVPRARLPHTDLRAPTPRGDLCRRLRRVVVLVSEVKVAAGLCVVVVLLLGSVTCYDAAVGLSTRVLAGWNRLGLPLLLAAVVPSRLTLLLLRLSTRSRCSLLSPAALVVWWELATSF
jgi:hypothetical protein